MFEWSAPNLLILKLETKTENFYNLRLENNGIVCSNLELLQMVLMILFCWILIGFKNESLVPPTQLHNKINKGK